MEEDEKYGERFMRIKKGDIKLGCKLGEGGFGEVWKASHKQLGIIAIKRLKTESVFNERAKKMLKREAKKLSELGHKNIIGIYGMMEENGYWGIVLEYAKYHALDDFLRKYGETVSLSIRLSILEGIACGMNYLHSRSEYQIIHKDLKACNVLIVEEFVPKITDFGLSEWRQYSKTCTSDRPQEGTITHIAPELLNDINHKVCHMFDVYSYGILIWETLTGTPPWPDLHKDVIIHAVKDHQRPSLQDIPSTTPQFVRSMMESCWNKQRFARPSFSDILTIFQYKEAFLSSFDDDKVTLLIAIRDHTAVKRVDSCDNNAVRQEAENEAVEQRPQLDIPINNQQARDLPDDTPSPQFHMDKASLMGNRERSLQPTSEHGTMSLTNMRDLQMDAPPDISQQLTPGRAGEPSHNASVHRSVSESVMTPLSSEARQNLPAVIQSVAARSTSHSLSRFATEDDERSSVSLAEVPDQVGQIRSSNESQGASQCDPISHVQNLHGTASQSHVNQPQEGAAAAGPASHARTSMPSEAAQASSGIGTNLNQQRPSKPHQKEIFNHQQDDNVQNHVQHLETDAFPSGDGAETTSINHSVVSQETQPPGYNPHLPGRINYKGRGTRGTGAGRGGRGGTGGTGIQITGQGNKKQVKEIPVDIGTARNFLGPDFMRGFNDNFMQFNDDMKIPHVAHPEDDTSSKGSVHYSSGKKGANQTVITMSNVENVMIGDNNVTHIHSDSSSRNSRNQNTGRPRSKAKVPAAILDSVRKTSDQDLTIVSKELGSRWKPLGRQVGLTNAELEIVDHDNHMDGLKEKCYQMLRKWREKTGRECTIGKLARALCEVDLSEVAARLPQ